MLISVILASLLFFFLDSLWMGLFMGGFYKEQLSEVLRLRDGSWNHLWQPLLFLYPLMGFGLWALALRQSHSLQSAALNGAIWGLVVYGIYELTNYSIVENWTLKILLLDTLWGAFLGASVASLTYVLAKKFAAA